MTPTLPPELWLIVFKLLPFNSLAICQLLSRQVNRICKFVPAPINVLVQLDSYPEAVQMVLKRNTSRIDQDWSELSTLEIYVQVKLSTLAPIETIRVQEQIHTFVLTKIPTLKDRGFVLIWDQLLDRQRSESSYRQGESAIDQDQYLQISRLMQKPFRHVIIRHPIASQAIFVPSNVDSISFERVHNSMNSFECLKRIRRLRFESDGRFLNQEGQFDFTGFKRLAINNNHLKHLILDGPWLECMVNYSIGAIEAFKSIKGLETLIVDMDMIKYGPDLLYSVIASLPSLKRVGRFGRVDKRFWRLFAKYSCRKVTTIELGTLKVPHTLLHDVNPSFLKDMAFGILWSFPNVKCLRIFLGFQSGSDQDLLLEIVRTLKEGIPLVFKEYEASTYADPYSRKLEKVQFFQCSDVELIQDTRWKYVAMKHGGGKAISLFATDGSTTDKDPGATWKEF